MNIDNGVRSPSRAPNQQQVALQGLIDYCQEQNVYVSPAIAAQHYPGRGMGVYTLRPLRKDEKLMHIPPSVLLTTRNVPEKFLSKAARKKMTVHCVLAAFLAFGDEVDLQRYRRWMATWPPLEEFAETMPVLWMNDFRDLDGLASLPAPVTDKKADKGHRPRKRRKTLEQQPPLEDPMTTSTSTLSASPAVDVEQFSYSLGVDNQWLRLPQNPTLPTSGYPISHVAKQAAKIRADLVAVDKYLPHIKIRSPSSHAAYLRFIHMWCCINSRCFYYLRPGQSPPKDSNEAMALCPFQDLFNHSDTEGCSSLFDKRGFFVRADRPYSVGEELFLRYGQHDNDMLWMEYGFMMDANRDDHLKIDRVVLRNMTASKRAMLSDAGYLGDYALKAEGVCYRTVVASYVGVLDDEQWKRMVVGGFDPETVTPATTTKMISAKLRAKRTIVDWILEVRREAEHNLRILIGLGTNDRDGGDGHYDELIRAFVGRNTTSPASLLLSLQDRRERSRAGREDQQCEEQQNHQSEALVSLQKTKAITLAWRRRDLCIRRWKQIFDMCMSALRILEVEVPESFVYVLDEDETHHKKKEDGEEEEDKGKEKKEEKNARTKDDLEFTADEFIRRIAIPPPPPP